MVLAHVPVIWWPDWFPDWAGTPQTLVPVDQQAVITAVVWGTSAKVPIRGCVLQRVWQIAIICNAQLRGEKNPSMRQLRVWYPAMLIWPHIAALSCTYC
jgi:hypothetical protein